jgi:hypothetical protein
MGCQCNNNQNEEDINDELIKKNSLEEGNELEKDQDNNIDQKEEGLFGLINQENMDPTQQQGILNNNENNLNTREEEYHENEEKEEENDEKDNFDNEEKNVDKNRKYSNYPQKMLELINKIREDPVSYADIIEDSILNILEDQNEEDENKPKIIYKKKVKVALTRGEPAFKEAAEKLRNLTSLPPLEFKNDICVPLPDTEEEIRNPSYLKEHVNILRKTEKIDVFFKDLIKIPEVSALLMIVDDNSKNPGKKRQAVLNKNFKYIGISSKFIGKTFIAYFTFSTE